MRPKIIAINATFDRCVISTERHGAPAAKVVFAAIVPRFSAKNAACKAKKAEEIKRNSFALRRHQETTIGQENESCANCVRYFILFSTYIAREELLDSS